MKYLFALLGMAAALAAPLSVQANPEYAYTSAKAAHGSSKTRKNAAVVQAPNNTQAYYYITHYTPTGSHIPLVICKYQGHYYPMNTFAGPGAGYDQGDIATSGALSVGGALRTLDPAISSVH